MLGFRGDPSPSAELRLPVPIANPETDCSSHYPNWRAEFPDSASRFQPGGFGENLVTAHMNERNVCIGDIVSVGTDGLLLQVSLPRQPCFKLNHRFQLRNFAPNTYKLSRTGWYYRVLQEGTIQVRFTRTFFQISIRYSVGYLLYTKTEEMLGR